MSKECVHFAATSFKPERALALAKIFNGTAVNR